MFFFAALTLAAFVVFSDTRNPFADKQEIAIRPLPAENTAMKTPAVVENDIEEISVNEETENAEPTDTPAEEEKNNENANKESQSNLPAYVPAARNSNELVVGFVTDLHAETSIQNDGTRVIRKVFAEKINYFVEKMNNETVPDFMVINGDVIEGTRTPTSVGIQQLQLIKNIFDRSAIQKYWVLGNHDLRSVTKEQWKSALGINYLRKSFEFRNYKIIILDSNFTSKDKNAAPGNGYTRGHVSKEEIKWLKNELKNTEKKALVFIHHPPLWGTDSRTNEGFIDNAQELREIFSNYGVLAVFGGHLEDLYYEKTDNVKYFVLPGIYKHPKYPGAYGVINVKENRVDVDFSYLANGRYITIEMEKK